ncbi:MAG: hypothetical protein K0Q51_520 [Rickettsiaceae bacterium]|jgi:hypothetical protein|nr:hypothetical protein [Rickettsiaceae bacterium]
MFNFGDPYRMGGNFFKSLMKNPLSLVIYGFFSKWYLLITLTSIIVVYWVYSGLKGAGVIDKAEAIITKALHDSKAIAQNCTPLITDIPALWQCVNNPPPYKEFSKEDLERIRKEAAENSLTTGDRELDELINPYQDAEPDSAVASPPNE